MNASNYQHCVWLNLNGRWNYAVAGRTDPSEDFSSKEEAIQAMHAKIAEVGAPGGYDQKVLASLEVAKASAGRSNQI
jgi:hypothetical protein